MKAIVRCETKITGNKITITGELMDVNFPQVVAQRHTVGHMVSTNPHRPRMCRATNHGFLVERHGAEGFLFPMDEFASVALAADPKLSDAPLVGKHPTSFTDMILECKSESEVKTQPQVSDDGVTWTNLDKTLDASFVPEPGKHYRLELTNQSGVTHTKPFSTPKHVDK